jgi:hypothetical protein
MTCLPIHTVGANTSVPCHNACDLQAAVAVYTSKKELHQIVLASSTHQYLNRSQSSAPKTGVGNPGKFSTYVVVVS